MTLIPPHHKSNENLGVATILFVLQISCLRTLELDSSEEALLHFLDTFVDSGKVSDTFRACIAVSVTWNRL